MRLPDQKFLAKKRHTLRALPSPTLSNKAKEEGLGCSNSEPGSTSLFCTRLPRGTVKGIRGGAMQLLCRDDLAVVLTRRNEAYYLQLLDNTLKTVELPEGEWAMELMGDDVTGAWLDGKLYMWPFLMSLEPHYGYCEDMRLSLEAGELDTSGAMYPAHDCVRFEVVSEALKVGDVVRFDYQSLQNDSLSVTTRVVAIRGNEVLVEKGTFANPDLLKRTPVTLTRTVPELETVFDCDGRLWGCVGSTVYCTAKGKPFEWSVPDNEPTVAPHAFSVSEPTGAAFTAGLAFDGKPLFFSEHGLFIIEGTGAHNYAPRRIMAPGVAADSHRSPAVVGNRLFYLSPFGVYTSNGGVPQPLKHTPGKRLFAGVGASDGVFYYLLASDVEGTRSLYIYDPVAERWHEQPVGDPRAICRWNQHVLMATVDEQGGSALTLLSDADTADTVFRTAVNENEELSFERERELPFTVTSPTQYAEEGGCRLYGFEVECATAGAFSFTVSIDGGAFKALPLAADSTAAHRRFLLLPRNCRTYRWRVTGKGAAEILGVTAVFGNK